MIERTRVLDARYPFANGAGSDAVHRHPIYSYSVTVLEHADHHRGIGLTFTLGDGNELVCQAAEHLSRKPPRPRDRRHHGRLRLLAAARGQ